MKQGKTRGRRVAEKQKAKYGANAENEQDEKR